jgi:hypothetical protein
MRATNLFISQKFSMTIEEFNHNLAVAASPNGAILLTQRQLAIAQCAELAALIDRHTDCQESWY